MLLNSMLDATKDWVELESYLSPKASHVSIAEKEQKGMAEVVAAFQSMLPSV